MTKNPVPDKQTSEHAVPPPDDPLGRHDADPDGIGSAEAAALRVDAIRRAREMPADDQPPSGKK